MDQQLQAAALSHGPVIRFCHFVRSGRGYIRSHGRTIGLDHLRVIGKPRRQAVWLLA